VECLRSRARPAAGHCAQRSRKGLLKDELKTLFDRLEVDAFNAAMRGAMRHDAALRWYVEQGVWSFRVTTPYEFFDRSRAYTLEGVAHRFTCPVLVCQAASEHFNPGEAEKRAAALGDRAIVRSWRNRLRITRTSVHSCS
jgi:hypothetical protein